MPDRYMLDTLLTDHVTGALPPPLMMLADSLVEMNAEARLTHASLMAAGGALIDTQPPASLPPDMFDELLEKLEDTPVEAKPEAPAGGADDDLPWALRARLPGPVSGLRWQKVGGGARLYTLPRMAKGYQVLLIDVAPGKSIPPHTHRGHEYTMVLRGAYTDQYGTLRPGDWFCCDSTDTHAPVADDCEGCLCLAVLNAPLKFKGLIGFLINPFLKV